MNERAERFLALVVSGVMLAVGAAAAVVAAGNLNQPPQSRAAGIDPADARGCFSFLDLPGSERVPGDLTEQIEMVKERVQTLRELRFRDGVDVQLVAAREMRATLLEQLALYPAKRLRTDDLVLKALHLLPRSESLKDFYLDVFITQVAGLYLPQDDRLLVIAKEQGELLSPVEETVLAHEFEHALVDDNFGLPPLGRRPPIEDDRAAAEQALVEGSATALQTLYILNYLTSEQQDATVTEAAGAVGADYFKAPYALRRYGEFPYLDGMQFVCSLHLQGGWEQVDPYFDSPPTTTYQVMNLQRFGGAAPPPRGGRPGPGWELVRRGSFGALDLEVLLSAPGGNLSSLVENPREIATAWAGGAVDVYRRGRKVALTISISKSAAASPDLLCGAFGAWYLEAFPEGRIVGSPIAGARMVVAGLRNSTVLACDNDRVRIAIAPRVGTAARMIE